MPAPTNNPGPDPADQAALPTSLLAGPRFLSSSSPAAAFRRWPRSGVRRGSRKFCAWPVPQHDAGHTLKHDPTSLSEPRPGSWPTLFPERQTQVGRHHIGPETKDPEEGSFVDGIVRFRLRRATYVIPGGTEYCRLAAHCPVGRDPRRAGGRGPGGVSHRPGGAGGFSAAK